MSCCGFDAVAAAAPHIWISPHPGSPGDTVKIYGRDFGPKETIDIYLDKTDVAQVVTRKGGGFGKVPLTVPADALIGKHHITAVGRTSGDAAKKLFIVQAAWRELGFTAEGTRYNPYEATINTGNVSSLAPLWTAQTAGSVYSSPAVAYGMVYVGSNDGNLYAFDAMTGATKWMATTGAFLKSSPAVANGVVYVGSGDGHLYAFDAITGATKWTANAGYSSSLLPQWQTVRCLQAPVSHSTPSTRRPEPRFGLRRTAQRLTHRLLLPMTTSGSGIRGDPPTNPNLRLTMLSTEHLPMN